MKNISNNIYDLIFDHDISKLNYYESMTLGKKKEAIDTLEYFGEEILKEDEELRAKLGKISSYKMLN